MLTREAARVVALFISALLGALALFGITDGPLVQTLGEIMLILLGGETVRRNVYSKNTLKDFRRVR